MKHNKTEPINTKTSLFLREKRRFLWPGLRMESYILKKEGKNFKVGRVEGLTFFIS